MSKRLLILVLATVVSLTAQTNPLWHGEKVKNYLPDMTWPEVESLLARTDMFQNCPRSAFTPTLAEVISQAATCVGQVRTQLC